MSLHRGSLAHYDELQTRDPTPSSQGCDLRRASRPPSSEAGLHHPLRLSVPWGGPQDHHLQRQSFVVSSRLPAGTGDPSPFLPSSVGSQVLLADPGHLCRAEAPHCLLNEAGRPPTVPFLLLGPSLPRSTLPSRDGHVPLRPLRPFAGSLPIGRGLSRLPSEPAQPGEPPPLPRYAAAPAPPARLGSHLLRREL